MNKKLFFFFGLAAILATSLATSKYDFDDDFNKCVDESDDYTEGSSENDGDCTLYRSFQNISTQYSANWTAANKTAYNNFLAQIQVILANSTLNNTQKLILVSGTLDQFAVSNAALYSTFQYFNLTAITSVNTLQKIVVVKQQTIIQSTIILDSSNDCPLFDALLAAAQATGDSSCVSAVQQAIQDQLISIASNSSSNVTDQVIAINQTIQQLVISYPALLVQLQTTQIESFGFFGQFFECANTYEQQIQISTIFGGTYPNIPLLTYLDAAFNSTTVLSIKVAINNFRARIKSDFNNTSLTPEQRQVIFANDLEEFTALYYASTTTYLYPISFGLYGSAWDYCFTASCPPPTQIPLPVYSTLASESTTESTTILSSTPGCTCTCTSTTESA